MRHYYATKQHWKSQKFITKIKSILKDKVFFRFNVYRVHGLGDTVAQVPRIIDGDLSAVVE